MRYFYFYTLQVPEIKHRFSRLLRESDDYYTKSDELQDLSYDIPQYMCLLIINTFFFLIQEPNEGQNIITRLSEDSVPQLAHVLSFKSLLIGDFKQAFDP